MAKKVVVTVKPTYTHEIGPDELKALNMPDIENHMGDILPEVDRVLAQAGYPPGSKAHISIVGDDGKEIKGQDVEIL